MNSILKILNYWEVLYSNVIINKSVCYFVYKIPYCRRVLSRAKVYLAYNMLFKT